MSTSYYDYCDRQPSEFEPPSAGIAPTSYILLPTSYILHPASCILHPTSYILHPTSYILHPASYILHPTSYRQPFEFEPLFFDPPSAPPSPPPPNTPPFVEEEWCPGLSPGEWFTSPPSPGILHPTSYILHT